MSVYEWFKVCFKFSIALELEIYAISAMKTPANNQNKSSDMSKGIQEASFLQGSRKCGSTGAALLGNGRPNWGNDAKWEKKKKRGK